jgi:hypothetical protein
MSSFDNNSIQPIDVVVTGQPIGVSAVDLDIRNLSHIQDSVKVGDGVDLLSVNTDGSLNITDNGGSLTVDGLVTANQGTSPWIISGTVSISAGVGLATTTRVAVNNASAATLSISNSTKTQVIIYNEGGTLFVKLGSGASSTSFTYTMTPDSTLEINGYFGIITARKLSGSTFADVTEVGI